MQVDRNLGFIYVEFDFIPVSLGSKVTVNPVKLKSTVVIVLSCLEMGTQR